jgi:hypothetical protein
MDRARDKQKDGQKSRRKVRHTLEERHRLGISATARAAARRELKRKKAGK